MDKSQNKYFSIFVCLSLFYLFAINLFNGISRFESARTIASTGFKIIIAAYFLFLIPKLIRLFDHKSLCLIFISLIFIISNYVFFPNLNSYFTPTAINYMTICLPLALVSMEITDYDFFIRSLTVTSYIVGYLSIYLIANYVFSWQSIEYINSYSMSLGFGIIVPILVLIYKINHDRKIQDIIVLGILLLVVILYCSRGPLLGIVFFSSYIYMRSKIIKRQSIVFLLLVFGILLLALTHKTIILSSAHFLESMGIQSRTVQSLEDYSSKKTDVLNKRDEIWDVLTRRIDEEPFAIRGINAEWEIIGVYAHNIILELVYQFGILLGGFLLFILLIASAPQLFRKKSQANDICIIFLFASVPGLMFSNSLWVSSTFWLWIGLSIGNRKRADHYDTFQSEEELNTANIQ